MSDIMYLLTGQQDSKLLTMEGSHPYFPCFSHSDTMQIKTIVYTKSGTKRCSCVNSFHVIKKKSLMSVVFFDLCLKKVSNLLWTCSALIHIPCEVMGTLLCHIFPMGCPDASMFSIAPQCLSEIQEAVDFLLCLTCWIRDTIPR